MGSDILVSIPARAEFVHVLRAVTAGVAARHDFSYDEIEDLRLAVDEACGQLLDVAQQTGSVTLGISAAEGRVDIEVSVDAATRPWPPAGLEDSLTWQVLSALTDETDFATSNGGASLRLVKRRGRA